MLNTKLHGQIPSKTIPNQKFPFKVQKKSNFQILGHFLPLFKAESCRKLDIVENTSKNLFLHYEGTSSPNFIKIRHEGKSKEEAYSIIYSRTSGTMKKLICYLSSSYVLFMF